MTDIVLHDLEPEELDSPELRSLLRLATDYDDARLSRLLVEELPRLTALTAIPAAVGEGPPVALAAYAPPAPGPIPPRPSATIEYLATAETHRLRGLASALIAEIRRRHPGAAVRTRTDDDAIGFYRGLGFFDSPAPVDPRWPGRRRYDCLLAPRSPH